MGVGSVVVVPGVVDDLQAGSVGVSRQIASKPTLNRELASFTVSVQVVGLVGG